MSVLSHRVHRDLRDFFSMGSVLSVAVRFFAHPFRHSPKRVTCLSQLCLFMQQALGVWIGYSKENEMRMPNSIATWCLILFFLLYGLQAFGLTVSGMGVILGLLALGVAIFTLIGR